MPLARNLIARKGNKMARAPFDGISTSGVYGKSWKTFLKDLWKEIGEDNVLNGAATLGFFFTLAIFPAMIFLLNLLPYLPIDNLQNEINAMFDRLLPGESAKMLNETVAGIVNTKREGVLSLGALLTIWAASSGIYAIMQQLNITYDVVEKRPFWKVRAIAFGLVIGFGTLTLLALSAVILGNGVEKWLSENVPWNSAFSAIYEAGRWLFVASAFSLAFSLLYYFGPNVKQKFHFVTPGAALGVILVVSASLLFKVYVQNFGNYNATYGAIGSMVVLMLWLNILGLVILLGSEVNALLEHYSPEGKEKGELAPGDTSNKDPRAKEPNAA